MSELSWSTRPIREYLAESFAGEWGAEPLPGNVHVLRATDINDEGHVIGSGALRRLPIGKLTSRQLEDGDILLEGSGGGPDKPVGRVAFFNAAEHQSPSVCSNFFKTLRPDRRVVEPSFLWWKLMWFYRQPMLLTFQQQTTGIINLKFEEYLNAAIEVPADLAEQRAIAQILDTLDTTIRETEALIDKLKAVKQGLLHDLLTRGIDANGQLRPPQSEAPQLYKESPLGWIPREWEVAPLVSKIDFPEGQVDPRRLPFRDWVLIAPDHIESGTGQLIYTATAGEQQAISGKYLFEAGDVIYSKIRPYLRKAVLATHCGLCSADMYPLRPRAGLASRFLLAVILGDQFSRFAESVSMRSGFPKINRSEMAEFSIGWPPLEEQQRISQILEEADLKGVTAESEHAKLTRLKSGLMDDLLTGRVRVIPLLESVQQVAAQTEA